MVLREITFGIAYILGLKRTYKLFLKIQHKLISPKYPSLRDFAHRRTLAAFDVVLTIYRKVQERDIEASRNLGEQYQQRGSEMGKNVLHLQNLLNNVQEECQKQEPVGSKAVPSFLLNSAKKRFSKCTCNLDENQIRRGKKELNFDKEGDKLNSWFDELEQRVDGEAISDDEIGDNSRSFLFSV
ncbi:putative calcium-binding protein CML18-like [Capsicum annuum]|nr:putative calcium-binding protein CML18-like [Capsicum annuum]